MYKKREADVRSGCPAFCPLTHWVLIRKMNPKSLEVPSTPSTPVPLAMATWRPGVIVHLILLILSQLETVLLVFVAPWAGAHQAPLSMEFSR